MKKLKKFFLVFAALIVTLVIVLAAGTTVLVNSMTIHETVKTKTCWSDGTHCVTSIDHK